MDNQIKQWDDCATLVGGVLVTVTVVAIRGTDEVVGWSSADQSKVVYKVVIPTQVGRKYYVRQAHQLFPIVKAAVAS